MAEVSLRHIEKVYPHAGGKRRAHKAKDGEKKGPNLKVTDEGVLAVEDFNLEVADREFVVLVGPSGCGKSTTLRMVAGLEEISRGELYIDGKLVNDVEPKNRDIAMIFQSYALYPHMTVRGNMEFPLKLRKIPKEDRDKKVEEAAKILGITQYLDRKPKELSGGQRQRVAIGRAIVREPKVLLMDEPLSNLDAKLRNQMRAELIKLRERIDTTFMYVTHDQTEAMTLGDRIVVMKDGTVQQIGTHEGLNVLNGVVDVVELMGSTVNLHVNAYGHDSVIVAQAASLMEHAGIVKTGDAVSFSFSGNTVHFFSRETGLNLE